jgi:molybdopterin synthase sulfur carrier subunit
MTARPIHLLYFAWLRERIGRGEETLDLPEGVGSIETLIAWLSARDAAHAAAFANPRLVRAAVNQEFADPTTGIASGDEIAFFPPVTGG